MNNGTLLQVLASSNYIILNVDLMRALGTNCAIMIAELASEYSHWSRSGQLQEDGWFFSTVENVEKRTSLKEQKQRDAINKLKKLNILEVERRGLPAKRYFKINEERLLEVLENSTQLQENEQDSKELDVSNSSVSSLNFKELQLSNSSTNINNYNINKLNNNILNTKVLEQSSTNVENSELNTLTDKDTTVSKPTKKKLNKFERCLEYIKEFTDDENVRNSLVEFLNMLLEKSRLDGKTVYANQFKGKLSKLNSIPKEDWLECIQKATACGWMNFYPVSNTNNSAKNVFSESKDATCDFETEQDEKARNEFMKELKQSGRQYEF